MLAAIDESTDISIPGPVPACLSRWRGNLQGTVSLWEIVNQIAAHNLVHTGRVLQAMVNSADAANINPSIALRQPEVNDLLKHLRQLHDDCKSLSMNVTSDLVAWVIGDYTHVIHNWGQAQSTVSFVAAAYQQELAREFFMHIDNEKARYMRSFDQSLTNPAYGLEALAAFKGSVRDMTLAGNCFACGFNDACVFHLMRVLEKGLGALAAIFSEAFTYENWHNVIERLESKIRKIDSAFGADWRVKQQFYSESATEFMFFKDAWRNHVMHGRDEYDPDRAKNIFDHVCAFMRRLAAGGLKE
jgi:hypothetical protein